MIRNKSVIPMNPMTANVIETSSLARASSSCNVPKNPWTACAGTTYPDMYGRSSFPAYRNIYRSIH